MDSLKRLAAPLLFMAMNFVAPSSNAQNAIPVGDIEKELTELFQTAKATADGTSVVTAGSVLVLQKDHLLMSSVAQPVPMANVYKDGSIRGLSGAVSLLNQWGKLSSFIPGSPVSAPPAGAVAAAGATREFVAGEKFWVTRIDTRSDGVVFTLLSDPIKDVSYRATLTFPFSKKTAPTPDDVAGVVSEVFKIDAGDNSQAQSAGNQGGQQSGGQQGAAAAPAETKTIALGQTRDQVVATFGVPSKIMQLGQKEIDVFPDMKVTFVQNKVVDIK